MREFLIGVAVTIAAAWIIWFIRRPRLKVLFRHDDYGRVSTRETVYTEADGWKLHEPTHIEKGAEYVRVQVENTGYTTAMKCRAFLVDLELEDEKGNRKRVFFDSIPLSWTYISFDQPQSVDIPSGVRFNFDLFSTREDEAGFYIRFVVGPNQYRPIQNQPATLVFKVVVVAENASAQTISIRLKWKGIWNDYTVESIGD